MSFFVHISKCVQINICPFCAGYKKLSFGDHKIYNPHYEKRVAKCDNCTFEVLKSDHQIDIRHMYKNNLIGYEHYVRFYDDPLQIFIFINYAYGSKASADEDIIYNKSTKEVILTLDDYYKFIDNIIKKEVFK